MVNGCTTSEEGWLRSPNVGNSNNVYNVNTSGALNNNNAYNTNGVVPDCIYSPKKVSPETGGNQCTFMQGAVDHSPEDAGKLPASDVHRFAKCGKRSPQGRKESLSSGDKLTPYQRAIGFGALYRAAGKCANGVRWKESVQEYEHNRLLRTVRLRRELLSEEYKILPYIRFMIHEPKVREIISTRFRDRVFQRAMCDNGLYEQITRSFIYDNGACLKGRGTDFALNRLSLQLRRHYKKYQTGGWVLKLDIKKYFPSIPHEVAKAALAKRIKDKDFLRRIFEIIDSFPDDRIPLDVANDPFGKRGIALGSQVSQLIALAVLDDIDHYIKEQLKVKCYVRYMDDFVLVDTDREKLVRAFEEIRNRLGLTGLMLNKKSTLFPLKQGVVFLKFHFRFTETGKLVKRATNDKKARERRKLKALMRQYVKGKLTAETINEHFNGWEAHMKRGDTKSLVRTMKAYGRKLFKETQGGKNVKSGESQENGTGEAGASASSGGLSGSIAGGK